MTPAKLPPQMLKAKPRHITETQVGETFRVHGGEMIVGEDGSCYLSKEAKLVDITAPGLSIGVATELPIMNSLIPVASITIAETKGA